MLVETGGFIGGKISQPFFRFLVLNDHLAVGERVVNALCDLPLPHMRFLPVRRGMKWHNFGLVHFQTHTSRQCVSLDQALAFRNKAGGDGGHHRRAIDEREAFLVTEFHRFYAGFLHCLCAGHDFTIELRAPLACTDEANTRQRPEVSAGAK